MCPNKWKDMILYIVVLFCNLISFRYLLKKINFFRIAISWLKMQFMLCKPKHLCIEKKNHTYHSLHHTSSILHMARKYKFDIFKTKFRNSITQKSFLKADVAQILTFIQQFWSRALALAMPIRDWHQLLFSVKFCMGARYLKEMHGTVRKIKSKVTMTTTYPTKFNDVQKFPKTFF